MQLFKATTKKSIPYCNIAQLIKCMWQQANDEYCIKACTLYKNACIQCAMSQVHSYIECQYTSL